MEQISVLVVDDSALMRNLIGKMVESDPELRIAGKAMNGLFALQKLPSLDPDIIILDIEMPEMNGIEFLRERRKQNIEVPVIILSSLARKGAEVTMEALALGASDFLLKPSGSISADIHTVADDLKQMIKAYGSAYHRRKTKRPTLSANAPRPTAPPPPLQRDVFISPFNVKPSPPPVVPKQSTGVIDIIAIGISTGGPNALRLLLAGINPKLEVPIVIVQHMPAGFTDEFAKSLNRICPLDVKEAAEGDLVKPGRVLIAPGNRHMTIEKRPLASVVHLNDNAPVNGHRPSADVLFESVAKEFSNHAMAVIMTGMGRDGAQKIGDILREGGITLGQDEASSIVYGMPKVAFENGFVQKQVPLHEMSETIWTMVQKQRETV